MLLNEYHTVLAENVHAGGNAWLWKNKAMSDLTLVFVTEIAGDDVSVSQTVSTDSIFEQSAFLRNFEAVHWWCGACETASAAAASTTSSETTEAAATSQAGDLEERRLHSRSPSPSPSLTSEPASSRDGSTGGTDRPWCFHLHASVLSSSSLYFRARITSAVGVAGIRDRLGMPMEEAMESDECDAAAALLRFLYTSQFAKDTDGCCSAQFLLQMMEVRGLFV